MSFRQFGGLQYAARNNIVSSSYNTNNNLQVTGDVGQSNSYINFLSDISGNISIYGDLSVSGDVTANQFTPLSDYRIKENIKRLDDTFTVDNLIPVTYINKNNNKQDIGLIAHELQEIYPFLVNGEKDGPETQSINYMGLIGILIKEIQELKKEIKLLQK
jgi:hypothetical protein